MDSSPLFLIGAPRSGTTWWLRLLSSHADISGLCEAQLFTHSGHPDAVSCAATRRQPFWSRLRRTLGGGEEALRRQIVWQPGHWDTPVYGPTPETPLRRLLQIEEQFESFESWDAIARRTFETLDGTARYLLEKSPINARHTQRILAQFPNARFLGILRDGRDVMASARALDTDWIRPHGQLPFAAQFWVSVTTAMLRLKATMPDRCHLIRYEDLVAQPAERLRNALRFLELDTSDAELHRMLEQNSFQRYSGRDRGNESRGVFFRRGTSGGYQRDLPQADVARFERIAGPLLERLGYPLAARGGVLDSSER